MDLFERILIILMLGGLFVTIYWCQDRIVINFKSGNKIRKDIENCIKDAGIEMYVKNTDKKEEDNFSDYNSIKSLDNISGITKVLEEEFDYEMV